MTIESYDFVVIGSGPAGQKAAIQVRKCGKSCLLIEKSRMVGGACVHRGTIPSKTLRETTLVMRRFQRRTASVCDVELPENLRIDSLLQSLDHVLDGHVRYMGAQLERNAVEIAHGRASFVTPNEIQVQSPTGSTRVVRAGNVIIAVGSKPRRPPEIPIDHERIYDSDSILSMTYLPESLIVLGAGVIASEYASIFAALGVKVTMVDRSPRPLSFLDDDLTERFVVDFRELGGDYIGEDRAASVAWNGFDAVEMETENGERRSAEKLLCALGRVPLLDGLGAEEIGLELTDRGQVEVDEYLRTNVPGVYACGDVIGAPSLASSSMEQGRRAARHALGLDLGISHEMIPTGIYSIPEIASVGLTEAEATDRHGRVAVGRADFGELARGQISGETRGMLKLVADRETDRLLGVHVIGEGATELVHVGQMAMIGGSPVSCFSESFFNFPTLGEAYRVASLDLQNQLQVDREADMRKAA